MTQYHNWSQMSGLPDDLLDEEVPHKKNWEDLNTQWNPPVSTFCASLAWQNALKSQNLPINDANLGLSQGPLHPTLAKHSISKLTAYSKAEILIFQLVSNIRDRTAKVADLSGEALCSFHHRIITEHNPSEGSVIISQNVTILPDLVINLTESNIVKFFS